MSDSLLQQLVRVANDGAFATPVMLHLTGTTVAGTLVGAKEYFQGIAAHIEKECMAMSNETRFVVRRIIESQDHVEAGRITGQTPMIHLRAATVYQEGREIRVAWWRAPLDSVNGFSLMAPPPPPPATVQVASATAPAPKAPVAPGAPVAASGSAIPLGPATHDIPVPRSGQPRRSGQDRRAAPDRRVSSDRRMEPDRRAAARAMWPISP